MAKVSLSSSTVPAAALFPNRFPAFYKPHFHAPKKIIQPPKILAKLGGGDGEAKRADKKKFITREEEPEQ
ncbi:hypothetical protein ACLOJK_000028 [Asimina triloba]